MERELQAPGERGTIRSSERRFRASGQYGECSRRPYRDADLGALAGRMAATLADAEPDTQTNSFADTNADADCAADTIAKADPQNFAQTAQGGHAESDSHQRADASGDAGSRGRAIVRSDTIAKPDRDSRNPFVSDFAAHVSDDVRDRGSLPDCIADDLGNAHRICFTNPERIAFIATAKCDSDFARFADGVANRWAERHDEPVCSIVGPAQQFADGTGTSAPNRDSIAAIGNPDTRTHRNADISGAGI
jgi:hypothetical protein